MIELVHHKNRESWPLYPQFRDRVRAFVQQYDSDANFEVLEGYLRLSFVADDPTCLMFVNVDADGIVNGHCFAMAENWMGNKVITIVQLESDVIVPRDVWARGMALIHRFARHHRATLLQLAARNPAVARLFRKHGFHEVRVLMRQPVEGGAELPSS